MAGFAVEKLSETVGPRRVDPLAGPYQRVHRVYKCTVRFDEWRSSDERLPFDRRVRHRAEVIYLERVFLRR